MHTSSKLAARLLVAASSLALPLAALAQEHGADAEHAGAAHTPTPGVLPTIGEGIAPMIVTLVVFSLLLAVLGKTAWPKIVKGLDDRAGKIRSEIEAAEMAQKQAKAALEQYEKSLGEARAEAQKMITDALAQQQSLVAENKAKAEQELGQMRERARRDIDAARAAAVEEVYAAAVGQAAAMAGKILKREVTPRDQQRLVEESLAELNALGKNN